MNIFILGFVECDDSQSNNLIQSVLLSNKPSNLLSLTVNSVPESCNYGGYSYGDPSYFGIISFPAVIFLAEYEEGQYTKVDELQGSNVSDSQIRSKLAYLDTLSNPTTPGQGGIIPTTNEDGNGLGLGLLPQWVLLALAGAAGYKAYKSKKALPKYGFGAAALYLINMAGK